MKILYTENPLETIIEVDDKDKEIMRLHLMIETLEDALITVKMHLDHNNDFYNIDDSLKATRIIDDMQILSENVFKRCQYYIDSLKYPHVGDCTSVSCSCEKCHAEHMLHIDTIDGLEKHSAYKIKDAFTNKKVKTCEDAIKYLEDHPTKVTQEWHKEYVERWEAERIFAIEWLTKYKKEKLNK